MKTRLSLLLLIFTLLLTTGCTQLGLGKSPTPPSMVEAEKYYTQALSYYDRQFYIQAVQSFRQASELGHANAQYRLAKMYYDGQGVAQRDSEQTAKWFRQAAEQNHASAQYYLGALYFVGSGVPQDYTQAYQWYLKAAEQNQKDAQLSLGMMYFRGANGIPQNLTEAKKWLLRATQNGSQEAQQALEEVNMTMAKQSN